MTEPTKSLLNLEITFNRNTINIQGTEYEVRHPDEFGLIDAQFMSFNSQEMINLNSAEVTEETAAKMEGIVEVLVKRIFVALPDDVLSKLNTASRIKVIEAFMAQFLGTAAAEKLEEETEPPSPPIGDTPSEGSKDSTEVTPSVG